MGYAEKYSFQVKCTAIFFFFGIITLALSGVEDSVRLRTKNPARILQLPLAGDAISSLNGSRAISLADMCNRDVQHITDPPSDSRYHDKSLTETHFYEYVN